MTASLPLALAVTSASSKNLPRPCAQQDIEQTVGAGARPVVVARKRGEPQKVLRGDPVRVGRGVVGGCVGAQHQPFGIVRVS